MIMSGFDSKVIESARQLGVRRGLDIVAMLRKPVRVDDLTRVFDQYREVGDIIDDNAIGRALAGVSNGIGLSALCCADRPLTVMLSCGESASACSA